MSQSIFEVRITVLRLKRLEYKLEYMKSHWKGSEIYRFSRSTTQHFCLRRETMVANIFEDFEPSSKKFLPTPLILLLAKN